ncbi:MAG TPA: sigma-70 family RNA polymerase sigma factor [Prosthecobacter sp.]|nr:sigma-70 family RNA polymerase sigma factor [Prosthecobacter sp.]HRK14264.1 sigma-70 family RNA polymerase sigma factor [Prosthecobacter sp.]
MTAEQRFTLHLPLAAQIAAGYANIPGVSLDDIRSVADAALHRASLAFDAEKGDFKPYAARAIRNALNDLHQKQARQTRLLVGEADLPQADAASTSPSHRLPDAGADVVLQIREAESRRALEQALAALPVRGRQILALLAQGCSYSEMGERLGVSKQAASKAAAKAMQTLREELARQGFHGLDTQGLLKTDPP